MKVSIGTLARTTLCLAALAFASAASAQATRTWVSGVGDDANPCSRTAPCKTFAGAISKTADVGEIDALDPAGYGNVTITKSMVIDGGGTHASILNSAVNGINVNAPGKVVILRNLSINGAGTTIGINGINVVAVGELHLENVVIQGQSGQGVLFSPNATASLYMTNVSVRNAGGGVLLSPDAGAQALATINRSTFDGNGRGVRAEGGAVVTIRDSTASGNDANGFVGLSIDGRPVNMTLENCLSSNNLAVGIYAGAATTLKMSNCVVTRNAFGLQAVDGGAINSFGNNRVNDNNAQNGPASSTIPLM